MALRINRIKLHYFSYGAENACLVPLWALHGSAVITVEGVGNVKKLHPVQERLAAGLSGQEWTGNKGFISTF